MIKKLPLIFTLLCVVTLAFSQEKVEKSFVYTSADTKGYISIKKSDLQSETGVSTIIETAVNAQFDNETLNFSIKTFNDSDKMVDPNKLVFRGTMDSNIAPVIFEGNRLKKVKNASYWNFKGDYDAEAIKDPELKPFFQEKYMSTLRLPDRTIPSFNLWAIIPKLKFERDGTFIFNALDETKLYVRKNQTVNYLGKFKTSIKGEDQKLHKFVHQGKRMKPAYFWVNDDRVLVQVLLDDKFTFTLDKNAKTTSGVAQATKN